MRLFQLVGLSLGALALFWCSGALAGDTARGDVYSYRIPASSDDHRFSYELALLRLALDKTRKQYGTYQLKPAFAMNLPRAMAVAKSNTVENLVIKTSYSEALAEEFLYPPFPIDRGIFSYRICFANDNQRQVLNHVKHLSDLQTLSIGQGVGWLDVDILRHNGFTVKESPKYESLFPMLAANRIDLVCRAQNEITAEWQSFSALGGFYVDETFALYYPLPRFFWIHKSNPKAFKRLNRGLEIAYGDGSALALWRQHYEPKLEKITLQNRRVFSLKNPFLDGIDPEYQRYFLNRYKVSETRPSSQNTSP